MSDHTNKTSDVADSATENSRRAFLKKAGKFAVYTPPAVMMLSRPSYATICKSYVGRNDKPKFKHSYKPSFKSSYKPKFKHSFKPGFQRSYKPKFSAFKRFDR